MSKKYIFATLHSCFIVNTYIRNIKISLSHSRYKIIFLLFIINQLLGNIQKSISLHAMHIPNNPVIGITEYLCIFI